MLVERAISFDKVPVSNSYNRTDTPKIGEAVQKQGTGRVAEMASRASPRAVRAFCAPQGSHAFKCGTRVGVCDQNNEAGWSPTCGKLPHWPRKRFCSTGCLPRRPPEARASGIPPPSANKRQTKGKRHLTSSHAACAFARTWLRVFARGGKQRAARRATTWSLMSSKSAV